MSKKTNLLYISYDGLLDPLGQSQILQYLIPISNNVNIFILSFEKESNILNTNFMTQVENVVELNNIKWFKLKYHKLPALLSTFYDMSLGIIISLYLILKYRIDLVHARSYIPATIAYILHKFLGIHYLFDMRGFWVDERIDGGIWSKDDLIYKVSKKLEVYLLKSSAAIVTLTNASIPKIYDMCRDIPPIHVIPTCVNHSNFLIKNKSSIKRSTIRIGYIGSLGTWYLLSEILDFYIILRKYCKDSELVFINQNDEYLITSEIAKKNLQDANISIIKSEYLNVSNHINSFDFGLCFIKNSSSKIASFPTKFAEYLACGVPVIANPGVGDIQEIMQQNSIGFLLNKFDSDDYDSLCREIVNIYGTDNYTKMSLNCVDVSKSLYNVDVGVKKYINCYEYINEFRKHRSRDC